MSQESKEQVVIVMGSESDKGYATRIAETLAKLRIDYEFRIASAHKTPSYLVEVIESYNNPDDRIAFIAVAGRSNGLGPATDALTPFPVFSAPPYSEKYAGLDVLSSLRTPSGIGAPTVIEPEGAAIAAAKALAIANPDLRTRIREYQIENMRKIKDADASIMRSQP